MVYQFPVSAEDAPKHAVYPFITHGYRKGGTYLDNVNSLFQLHTETMNAWTMIFASVWSIYASYSMTEEYGFKNTWIFWVLTSSALIHLPFSVGYHLFMSMDLPTFNHWRRMDVIAIFGVSVLLTYSLAYYAFSTVFCLSITALSAIVAGYAITKISKLPEEKDINPAQHTLFVSSIVACYMCPMFWVTFRDVFIYKEFTLASVATIIVLWSLGFSGWAYSTSWPQKLFPGKFNIVGHSHQVMHIGVFLCHVMEWMFVYALFQQS